MYHTAAVCPPALPPQGRLPSHGLVHARVSTELHVSVRLCACTLCVWLLRGWKEDLRGIGLGYRAKFVLDTARAVQARGGPAWLLGLRDPARTRSEVQAELVQLAGVCVWEAHVPCHPPPPSLPTLDPIS